jgi:signal peptidase I
VRLSPFWGDVLGPALHALAPGDPVVVARRLRNTAVATAFLSGMLPSYGPLGTGTVIHASVVPGAYAVAAVIAHQRREAAKGDLEGAAAVLAAGVVPLALSGGLAAAFHVACSRTRADRVEMEPPPLETDPLPARQKGAVFWIGRLAYTLATIFVFWSLVTQHMRVPTGSMQPTILGHHGPMNRYHGDSVLADHMVYLFREPRRFDIVVFRYPLRRDILFVKRLVGLPGETVEIKGGDIWVDGEVAVKPPIIQASLWQQLFPKKAASPSAKPRDVANAWRASEDDGWRKEGDAALRIRPREGKLGVAAYRDRLEVSDLRVGFTADRAADDAVAVARVLSRGRLVTLRVPGAGSDSPAELAVEGGETVALDARLAGATRVELAVADGVARAFVEGREVATVTLPAEKGRRNRAEIGGSGGELVLRNVTLDEDVYYRALDGGTSRWVDIPADRFVVLGDNSKNSEDSRVWAGRTFTVEGREAPLIADDWSPDLAGGRVRHVVRKGGRVTFVDADGLPRDLPASSITSEEPREPMPFVHRNDLVGRAALIFWPVPPFGSSFRPRLLP